MLYKCNHTVCNRLGLAFFIQHISLDIHLSWSMYYYFVPFNC